MHQIIHDMLAVQICRVSKKCVGVMFYTLFDAQGFQIIMQCRSHFLQRVLDSKEQHSKK